MPALMIGKSRLLAVLTGAAAALAQIAALSLLSHLAPAGADMLSTADALCRAQALPYVVLSGFEVSL